MEKIQRLQIANNSKIIKTKRGQNNPHHMFVKPKCTRDPAKQKLERIFVDPLLLRQGVPVGTYDPDRLTCIGNKDTDQALLEKIRNTEFNLYKMETENKMWIERARADYMSKIKKAGGNESLRQFLAASGFEPDEDE